MSPEEFKKIVETAVENSAGLNTEQIIILIIISGVSAFLGSFIKEKAKSIVTRKDITEITQKVEDVKLSVEAIKNSESKKYELKYNACIEALRLVDAHLSHSISTPEIEPTKQTASIEEARSCHNQLILSCESTELISTFNSIMFGFSSSIAPTDELNNFRNAIRRELNFGDELSLDRNQAWFAKVNFDKSS